MTLKSVVHAGIAFLLQSPQGLGSQAQVDQPSQSPIQLASGVAADQADLAFHGTRTIAASGTDVLDLAGTLLDPLGAVLTFVKIKAIYIKASRANTNNVVISPGATNPFNGPFGGTTPTITLPPGGVFEIAAPINGWPVTPSTGDLFKIANSGAGTGVDYDIEIVGTSA